MASSSQTTKLAMLFTADGVDVQDQGWELLRCLPEIAVQDVQAAMTGLLWAQIQLRAWTDVLGYLECQDFTRRYFALRNFSDRFGLPWRGARLQVDRWRAVSAQNSGRIRLGAGHYEIGRRWTEETTGAYAMISIPERHPLRVYPAAALGFGGMYHGRFVLDRAAIVRLDQQHPACAVLANTGQYAYPFSPDARKTPPCAN